MTAIRRVTEIPGPNSRALLERRAAAVARGLAKSTDVVIDRAEGALVHDVDGNTLGHSQRMLAGPMPDAVQDQRDGQRAGGIGDLRCGPHRVRAGPRVGKSPVGAGSPA